MPNAFVGCLFFKKKFGVCFTSASSRKNGILEILPSYDLDNKFSYELWCDEGLYRCVQVTGKPEFISF